MMVQVQSYRKDHVNPEEIIRAFTDLGWDYGGKLGMANYAYQFAWNQNTEPVYPEGTPYEITEINLQ